jgi:hypothetical protein
MNGSREARSYWTPVAMMVFSVPMAMLGMVREQIGFGRRFLPPEAGLWHIVIACANAYFPLGTAIFAAAAILMVGGLAMHLGARRGAYFAIAVFTIGAILLKGTALLAVAVPIHAAWYLRGPRPGKGLDIQHDRDGTVVDEGDLHMRPEDAGLDVDVQRA